MAEKWGGMHFVLAYMKKKLYFGHLPAFGIPP